MACDEFLRDRELPRAWGDALIRELVLVHGRAQEHKDAVALKEEWLTSLDEGLRKSGLALPIPVDRVKFPYYGQALFDRIQNLPPSELASVVVRASGTQSRAEELFVAEVLEELANAKGISDEFRRAKRDALSERPADADVHFGSGRGPLHQPWIRQVLTLIDRYLPSASAATVALVTRDVHRYLSDSGLRGTILTGVRQAMSPDVQTVVVGHSLGSVVAYDLLRRDSETRGWNVPLLLTLGSPLGVSRIWRALAPNAFPACVGTWFNASDPADLVALHPLDDVQFPVEPPVENKVDVENSTPNHHGITGYLNDPVVAQRIYDALTAE